ncbi:MAG: hypothetical protein ABIP29_07410 [Candidatus Eisenbacteria bacterium]
MKKRTQAPVLRRRFDFDRRTLPLGVWILALVLSAAFVEVWQVTRESEITFEIDRTEAELGKASARRDALDAQLAGHRTRTALEAQARRMGMKPAEPHQIVVVPAAFLAGGGGSEEGGRALVALGRRVAETLVPSARARTRTPSPN